MLPELRVALRILTKSGGNGDGAVGMPLLATSRATAWYVTDKSAGVGHWCLKSVPPLVMPAKGPLILARSASGSKLFPTALYSCTSLSPSAPKY